MQLIRKIAHAENKMSDKFFAYTKLQVVAGGCLWVAGLLIAGSDSPYMPWLNGIGAVVFSGTSIALGKLLSRLEQDASGGFPLEQLSCSMADINNRDQKIKNHNDILPCAVNSQARIFSNF